MIAYDLSYIASTGGQSAFNGRCTGAQVIAQSLLCLMVSPMDGLRPYGGDLYGMVGMANADPETLRQVVSLALAGAVSYYNTAQNTDVEATVDGVDNTNSGLGVSITVTTEAGTATASATVS